MEMPSNDLLKNTLASPTAVALLKRTIPPMDKALMRASRGWLNTGFQSVAMVETIGARSGEPRNIVTLCMPVGRDLILVGSNWGQDHHPAWYFNLKANPEARVTFRGYKGSMSAQELRGRQRAEMWDRLVHYNPQYAQYQSGTNRQIPVLQLRRADVNQP